MTEKIEDILGAIAPTTETEETVSETKTEAEPMDVLPPGITEAESETGGHNNLVKFSQALEDVLAESNLTIAQYRTFAPNIQEQWNTHARTLFKKRVEQASSEAFDSVPHYLFVSNGELYHTRANGTLLDRVYKNLGVTYELIKGEIGFFPETILRQWERKRLLHESREHDPEYNSAIMNDFYAKVANDTFISADQKAMARDRYGNPWATSPLNPVNK